MRLLACLATFTLGAGFSIWRGVSTIRGGEELVLAAAGFGMEGVRHVFLDPTPGDGRARAEVRPADG